MAAPWRKNEVDFMMDYIERELNEGKNVMDICAELSEMEEVGKRTSGSIMQKYYKELRSREKSATKQKESSTPTNTTSERQSPEPKQSAANEKEVLENNLRVLDDYTKETPIRKVSPLVPKKERMKVGVEELLGLEYDWEVVEAFEGLPDYIRELRQEVEELKEQVKKPTPFNLSAFLAEMNSLQARVRSVEKLEETIQVQYEKIQELESQLKLYEQKFDTIKQDYQDACGWFDVFMSKSSINQMMAMGDMKSRLKGILDKWGNVISLEIEHYED